MVSDLICATFGRLTWATNSLEDRFAITPAMASLFLCAGRSCRGERKTRSDHTARAYDPDSQLQNNLNRWYDARVDRWLSEDPIGFDAGDSNLYRYAGNTPGNWIDPLGHWTWPWNWGKPSRPVVPPEPPQLIPPVNPIPGGHKAIELVRTFSYYFRQHRTWGAACEAIWQAILWFKAHERCGEVKHLEGVYAAYCAGTPWALG